MKEHSSQVEDVLERLNALRHWSKELEPRQRTLLTEAIEHLSSVLQDLVQADKLPRATSRPAPDLGQASAPGTVKPRLQYAEQRLQDTEKLFRPLAENVNLVFWMRAPDTDEMLYVSPAYEKIWGRTRGSLYRAPQSFIEAVHPDDRTRVAESMAAHKLGGFDEEYRIVTPDGSVRWVSARTFPIREQGGEITRIAGVAQDITEQKKAEEALRTTLARMRERYVISRRIGAARMAEDVVNALRSLTTIADASRASIFVFSEPWGEAPPSGFDILVDWREDAANLPGLPDADHVLARHPLAKLFSRDGAVLVNDVLTDPRLSENDRDWLASIKTRSILLFPLITSDQWYGMFNVHYHFPTQMQLEDINYFEKVVNQAAAAIYNFHLLGAETRARQEAEEANELKLKFLAMISHELRTPLTSIKGFATTLLADDVTWDPNSQRDFVETISQEADKLTDLIEQLLDLSRLESGTLRIVPEEQSLSVIVKRAEAQLQVLTAAHHLAILIPEDLPPVRADPQRIAQVLTNLVNNATKYSPDGTQITVSAARQGQHVRVNVADEGPGIPPEERARVFEAFHQVAGGQDRVERTKGAGLGLAICRGLVEAQYGRIWIQDRPGPGTTVSFTLPIAAPPKSDIE